MRPASSPEGRVGLYAADLSAILCAATEGYGVSKLIADDAFSGRFIHR